ncbi:glycosyltransferase family 4 protein [Ignavibacteria bacterium 4148-Me]|uniref:glycosyltransferase family 4 protein n=1 Tax=Rosettibacter primus TaxID=3111523 RepID=UPI00336BEA75
MQKIILLGRFNKSEVLTGPEKIAKRILHYLSLRNCEVLFCDFYFKNKLDTNLFNRFFGYSKVENENNVICTGIVKLIFILLKNSPAIIHIVTLENYQIIIFLLKYFLKVKIIITFHGSLLYEIKNAKQKFSWIQKLKLRVLEKLAVSKADYLVFVSELLKNLFAENYDLLNKNCTVIYHGIDEIFYIKPSPLVNKSPLKLIFYNSSKYIERDLLKIYNTLLKIRNIELELYVIGDSFTDVVSKNNIAVFYKDYMNQQDLINFLEDKNILIKGDVFDSFSLFALECMAAGKIVIVSKKAGITELIKNNVNAILYNDYSELKSIIERLHEHDELLESISENARKICNHLKWENVINNYVSLYERVQKE